jgi:hypothetical protein
MNPRTTPSHFLMSPLYLLTRRKHKWVGNSSELHHITSKAERNISQVPSVSFEIWCSRYAEIEVERKIIRSGYLKIWLVDQDSWIGMDDKVTCLGR